MKSKSIVFESAISVLSILAALATGVSLVGKPLRLVDAITILALGIAGGAALATVIMKVRRERKQNPDASDGQDGSLP